MNSIAYQTMEVIPGLLEFRYAENRAIAFSMLSSMSEAVRTPLILGFSLLATVFLGGILWTSRQDTFLRLLPYTLILSGALGNMTDRLRHGYVVDFVHVHWKDAWSYPIFNVADSLICIGVAMALWQSFRNPQAEEAKSVATADSTQRS